MMNKTKKKKKKKQTIMDWLCMCVYFVVKCMKSAWKEFVEQVLLFCLMLELGFVKTNIRDMVFKSGNIF